MKRTNIFISIIWVVDFSIIHKIKIKKNVIIEAAWFYQVFPWKMDTFFKFILIYVAFFTDKPLSSCGYRFNFIFYQVDLFYKMNDRWNYRNLTLIGPAATNLVGPVHKCWTKKHSPKIKILPRKTCKCLPFICCHCYCCCHLKCCRHYCRYYSVARPQSKNQSPPPVPPWSSDPPWAHSPSRPTSSAVAPRHATSEAPKTWTGYYEPLAQTIAAKGTPRSGLETGDGTGLKASGIVVGCSGFGWGLRWRWGTERRRRWWPWWRGRGGGMVWGGNWGGGGWGRRSSAWSRRGAFGRRRRWWRPSPWRREGGGGCGCLRRWWLGCFCLRHIFGPGDFNKWEYLD